MGPLSYNIFIVIPLRCTFFERRIYGINFISVYKCRVSYFGEISAVVFQLQWIVNLQCPFMQMTKLETSLNFKFLHYRYLELYNLCAFLIGAVTETFRAISTPSKC